MSKVLCIGRGIKGRLIFEKVLPMPSIKEREKTMNVNKLYQFVEEQCEGYDSIYEDYLIRLVGNYGLALLKENKLIETCGVINGRQLYVLSKGGA